ncbi:MAG: FAD-dependent oxidoreductase [Acidimicrobiia bacterium]|nr:FAD-dependent oxidoreductase [Acidimicrobiia bacterium]
MAVPVILALEDNPEVLHQLREDLTARYADTYRVLTAHSAHSALDLLEHLHETREQVAVLIIDHDMRHMEASEFFTTLGSQHPGSKRVLLTGFDQDDAVTSILEATGATQWIHKPWDPAESGLYPPIDDLLFDWITENPQPSQAVRVIGHQWARDAHSIKDFLGRNQVPFRWLDLDRTREAGVLLTEEGLEGAALPVVLLADGTALQDPPLEVLAERLGMHVHADRQYYDVAIVGAGPAGLAAAVYGATEGLSTVLIEKEAPGGQAGTSSRIENYLGFPTGVSGADLARRALTQAKRFGAEVLTPIAATNLRVESGYKTLELSDGTTIGCRGLIIATGVSYRHLPAEGLDRLTGAGVYYGAATTEALAAEGQHVYVVGSANSAGQGAKYFSKFAEQVSMIVRGPDLAAHMSQYLIDQIEETDNIEVIPNTHVVRAVGDDHLEAIELENVASGEKETVPASFLFIFIGAVPTHDWLASTIDCDEDGYILTGPDLLTDNQLPQGWPLPRHPYHLETSVPGIFATGDVRHGSIRRVAGAVGEGSTAIQLVHRYLAESG